jgi:hypothetical protein
MLTWRRPSWVSAWPPCGHNQPAIGSGAATPPQPSGAFPHPHVARALSAQAQAPRTPSSGTASPRGCATTAPATLSRRTSIPLRSMSSTTHSTGEDGRRFGCSGRGRESGTAAGRGADGARSAQRHGPNSEAAAAAAAAAAAGRPRSWRAAAPASATRLMPSLRARTTASSAPRQRRSSAAASLHPRQPCLSRRCAPPPLPRATSG